MDKLKQLLEDYHESRVVQELTNETIREDRYYYRDTERVRGKLVDYLRAPRDPLDYICEQEEKQEILEFIRRIPLELSDVFYLSVIKGESNETICDFMGVHLSTVYRKLDKLQEWFSEHRSELTLGSHESTLEAHAPRDFIRYACEFYKDYYEGRVNRQGNYITHCRVERYLDVAFGDDKTCCGMCEKCSNGIMRKRRDNPGDRNYYEGADFEVDGK